MENLLLSMNQGFMPQSAGELVLYIIIVSLSIILALYLTAGVVKLSFWIVKESFKLTFLYLAIVFNTLIVVFLTAPIGIFIQERSLSDIIHSYLSNMKKTVYNFYPKVEIWANKKYGKPAPIANQTNQIQSSEQTRVIRSPISKSQEIDAKTVIITHPTTNKSKYFCTNCGSSFSPAMNRLLKSKSTTFCTKCGKKYNLKNGLPAPIEASA